MDAKDERTVTFEPERCDTSTTAYGHLAQLPGADDRPRHRQYGRRNRPQTHQLASSLCRHLPSVFRRRHFQHRCRHARAQACDRGLEDRAAVEFRPPAERVYTHAEIERHYAPIREALEPEDAAQFKWKAETASIQTYRNTETGRNIHVDHKGQFTVRMEGGRRTGSS